MQIEITSKELKKHIGKRARFLRKHEYAPISYRYGTVTDLKGRNVEIGGDWFYLKDLKSIEVDYETEPVPC